MPWALSSRRKELALDNRSVGKEEGLARHPHASKGKSLEGASSELRPSQRWWAARWLEALTQWISPERLAAGRECVQDGQVTKLSVRPGVVQASAKGPHGHPYSVRIEFDSFSDAQWEGALETLSLQAIHAAQLLNGEMPEDIDHALRASGVSIFPLSSDDAKVDCSCSDRGGSPCKHVAGVYYLIGQHLDEEPFLLFLVRGKTRRQVMASLREKRTARSLETHSEPPMLPAEEESGAPLTALLDRFWQIGPEIGDVQIKISRPEIDAEMLQVLGAPDFCRDDSVAERLSQVYDAVTRRALETAFGSAPPDEQSMDPDEELAP